MSHDFKQMSRAQLLQQIGQGRTLIAVPFYDLVAPIQSIARERFIGVITNTNCYDADAMASWRITSSRFPAGPSIFIATTEFFIRNPAMSATRTLWVGGRHAPLQLSRSTPVITIEELKL
jgi:hypothetical protein